MTATEETAPPEVQALATTVTGLTVIPQTSGVTMSFTTTTAVRTQLQIGTTSGTYPNKYTIESVPRTAHQVSAAPLAANTVYHYILQFMDQFGNLLDATADATFTTLTAVVPVASGQHSVNGPPAGGAISVNILAAAAVAGSATSTPGQDTTTVVARGTQGVTMAAGKLTVQQTGFYSVYASLQFAADLSTGEASYVRLLIGGSSNVGSGLVFKLGTGSSGVSYFIGQLSAGATIEVQVVNGTATATTVSSGSIAVGGWA
jgi:hypothetical protein